MRLISIDIVRVCLIFFLLWLGSVSVFAQPDIEWDKTLGGSSHQQLRKTIQLIDGSYILGGWSSSVISGDKTEASRGGYDYWIVKLNSSGGIIWQKTIGGNAKDELSAMIPASDGGFILGGSSSSDISGEKIDNSRGGLDYWVVKIDSFGVIQWQSTIGGSADDRLYSMSQSNDNGYILGGWSDSGLSGDKTDTSRGLSDYWIVKIDSLGNIQWQKTIGGSGKEVRATSLNTVNTDSFGGMAIYQTNDDGYILGGSSNSGISGEKTDISRGGFDYWILKLDESGNIQWQKTIGGNDVDFFYHLLPFYDNGYIVGGASSSGITGEKTENLRGVRDYWFLKLDNAGDIQWQKSMGGDSVDVMTHICLTFDSCIVISGRSRSPNSTGDKTSDLKGDNDYWIIKIDTFGAVQWQKTIGGSSWDNLISIEQTSDKGFFIGGTSQSGVSGDKTEPKRGARDYWVVKLYPDTSNQMVWPGDANFDGVANVYDILPIALGYNTNGLVRANASSNWVGQTSQNWLDTFSIGLNYKHADCDGNGIVDEFDIIPISLNYNNTHSKYSQSSLNPIDPDLYFEFSRDTFQTGDTILGTIQLGSMPIPVNDIYGIAFSIQYDAGIIDSNSFTVSFDNSWLINTDSSITLVKDLYSLTKIDIGIARINHTNKSGYGTLAEMSFVIQDNIDGKNMLTTALNLNFENVYAVSADENEVIINSGNATLYVDYENIEGIDQSKITIYPNPSNGYIIVEWIENESLEQLTLFDYSGREIIEKSIDNSMKNLKIETSILPQGIYFLEMLSSTGREIHRVTILK